MFNVNTQEKLTLIGLPLNLDTSEAEEFKNQSKAWLLQPVEVYVFDFKGTTQMTRAFYQAAIQFKTTLKNSQKSLYSINLSKALQSQIKADGVEQVFMAVESLDEAKKKAGIVQKARSMIDVEFINPFLVATKQTLEVQAQTPIKPLKPFLKREPIPDVAIAGVISLITDSFSGSITLCFPEKVFLQIYENMFGEKHTSITKELEDAAAEMLNIIYGQAKVELNKRPGYDFKKALPTVLTGEKLRISQSGRVPTVILPFSTDHGNFHIEIESEKH